MGASAAASCGHKEEGPSSASTPQQTAPQASSLKASLRRRTKMRRFDGEAGRVKLVGSVHGEIGRMSTRGVSSARPTTLPPDCHCENDREWEGVWPLS
jgi:hypothetical protein